MKNKSHWLVLLAMCGLSASSVGILINTVGVFYSPVSLTLGVLRGTFALHVTISTLVCAFVSLLVPKVLSEKNFKPILSVCIVIASLSTVAMAVSTHMWQFLLLGIIRGVGNAFFGMVMITIIVNNWFIKAHGFAISLVLSFGGISGAICSPLLAWIIENNGWNIGFMVMGIMILVFCIPFLLMKVSLRPESQGELPYGYCEDTHTVKLETKKQTSFQFLSISFLALFIFCLLLTSITSLTQHFPGFAQSIKVGAQVGSYMVSACMFGNIISKLILGVLSDKIGPFRAVSIMMIINAFASIMLLTNTSIEALLLASFLFGFIYSVSAVGMVLLTKAAYGDKYYNKAYPVISFAGNVGSALSVSLIGYVYDFTGSYTSAFVLIIAFLVISLLMLIVVYQRNMESSKLTLTRE